MTSIHRIGFTTAAIVCAFFVGGRSNGAPAEDVLVPTTPARATDRAPSSTEQPSPEMQSLTNVIAGRWSTEISYGSGAATSPVTTSHGEQVWRTGPGGFTLMEEERIGAVSGDRFLLAVHWWDKEAKKFRGLLCNNSGPGACAIDTYFNSTLAWDGKALSIDLIFPKGGKSLRWHEVFTDFTRNSFTQTGDMGEVGGALQRVLVIHAKRIDGSE